MVSTILNLFLTSVGNDAKIVESRTLARISYEGVRLLRTFQTACRAMGCEDSAEACIWVSVGPVTLNMASSTSSSSLSFAEWSMTFEIPSLRIDSPLTTSRSRTQRQSAPSFGASPLMRISARSMRASACFPSASAADIRAVRLVSAMQKY